MPVLGKPTLKRYFETGKNMPNQAFAAVVDSPLSVHATGSQSMDGELAVPSAAVVSASVMTLTVAERLYVTAATIYDYIQHSSAGRAVALQEALVTASGTTQFAFLPTNSQIVGLNIDVVRSTNAAGGGCLVNVGNASAVDFFGTVTVSGNGQYPVTNVCASRLQNFAGVVNFASPTATANAVFRPFIEYYVGLPASSSTSTSTSSSQSFSVTLSVSENNPNIVSKFLAAGWDGSSPIAGTITVNSSVVIGSTSTSVPALDLTSSQFPSGTTWTIVNNGTIQGKGGTGGDGSAGVGVAGGAGGTAIKINKAASINNGSGFIYGGGGGGGGGGAYNDGANSDGSGGGGGGAGTQGGSGGTGVATGTNGSAGTSSAGGAGGTASVGGGSGGTGGGIGEAGLAGSSSTFAGGAGGAAGKYIDGIAYATFTAGGSSPRVKGTTA